MISILRELAQIAGGLVESPVSDEGGHEAACVAAGDGKHLLVCVINFLAFFSFVFVHILKGNSL
jgi:hypothetical protein